MISCETDCVQIDLHLIATSSNIEVDVAPCAFIQCCEAPDGGVLQTELMILKREHGPDATLKHAIERQQAHRRDSQMAAALARPDMHSKVASHESTTAWARPNGAVLRFWVCLM